MNAIKALERKMTLLGHIGFYVIENNRSERLIIAQLGIPDNHVTIEIKVENSYDEFHGFSEVVIKDDDGREIKGGYAASIRLALRRSLDEIHEIVREWDLPSGN